jgi:hypothetical protein
VPTIHFEKLDYNSPEFQEVKTHFETHFPVVHDAAAAMARKRGRDSKIHLQPRKRARDREINTHVLQLVPPVVQLPPSTQQEPNAQPQETNAQAHSQGRNAQAHPHGRNAQAHPQCTNAQAAIAHAVRSILQPQLEAIEKRQAKIEENQAKFDEKLDAIFNFLKEHFKE